MKFRINVGNFAKSLFAINDIATKNVDAEIPCAFLVNLKADKKGITTTAYSGTASLVSVISDDSELKYEFKEEGEVTIRIRELMNALNSFPSARVFEFSNTTKNLVMNMIVGPNEDYQKHSIPLNKEEVKCPKIAKKFEKKTEVYRGIFVDAMNKVVFAMGWEDTNPQYECILFEANKGQIRLASGTGGRFAVDDITGNGVLDTVEKATFIFPKHNISNIISILQNSKSEKVIVRQSEASSDNPEQIMIATDDGAITLSLFGIDPNNVQYKNMDVFINNTYPYAVTSKLEDWSFAARGVEATYSEEMRQENDILNAVIKVDFDKSMFEVSSKQNMTTERTVKFTKSKQDGKDKAPVFRCNVNYLIELITRHRKSGEILMEIGEEKSTGKRAPIVVKFPEEPQAIGTKENFSMFFATAKH